MSTADTRRRERLAMVLGEAGPESQRSNGNRGKVTYLLMIQDVYGEDSGAPQPVPEELLEPAGSLGERYNQVVGPFSDFESMVKEAVSLRQQARGPKAIDIVGINWPQWLPVVEIRNTSIDVPVLHSGHSWAWHMGILARSA